jgi:hypothetical protein
MKQETRIFFGTRMTLVTQIFFGTRMTLVTRIFFGTRMTLVTQIFFWNADDAGDADFFGTRMTLVTRIFFWNADDAGDADFFLNADDADFLAAFGSSGGVSGFFEYFSFELRCLTKVQ